jgi:hypothetical protein
MNTSLFPFPIPFFQSFRAPRLVAWAHAQPRTSAARMHLVSLPTWIRILVLVLLAVTAARAESGDLQKTLPASGVNLARAGGGWINVVVENSQLRVSFFDEEKQPAPLAFSRAAARIAYTSRDDVRVVLNPEKLTLVSPRVVRPPHVFRVYLSLFADGTAEPTERYSFSYPN